MAKSAEAFRTISEVADWLGLPTHVLRFWESKFSQVKPVKRAGGRRYYRPNDMLLLGGIKKLLHDDGMTIKGAQKMLRDHGVKHVSELSQPLDQGTEAEDAIDAEALEDTAPRESPESAQPAPEDTPDSAEPASGADAPAATPESAAATAEDGADAEPEAAADAPRDDAADDERDAAPEPDEASAAQEPAHEQAQEPVFHDSGALPSFLRKPGEDAGDAAPAKARPVLHVDVPDDPADSEPDVDAGLLSRLAALRTPLDAEARHALEQARGELQKLSEK